jgi:hypothetical protein
MTTKGARDATRLKPWYFNSVFCLNPHSHISDDDAGDHGDDDALEGLK